MNPSRLFIERPVATSLLMVAILLSGMIAYRLLALSALLIAASAACIVTCMRIRSKNTSRTFHTYTVLIASSCFLCRNRQSLAYGAEIAVDLLWIICGRPPTRRMLRVAPMKRSLRFDILYGTIFSDTAPASVLMICCQC